MTFDTDAPPVVISSASPSGSFSRFVCLLTKLQLRDPSRRGSSFANGVSH
jgi:hypothetical protein